MPYSGLHGVLYVVLQAYLYLKKLCNQDKDLSDF